jgi:cellulose synthase/poly-beta-1,6-N-acetylglucosamine synthase-like glycosyltransferase
LFYLDLLLSAALGIYVTASLMLLVYGLNAYVMIVLYCRSRRRRLAEEKAILERFVATRTDADLPVVTTQLPIYNERNVIERLLRAVCAFDYPRDKHEIQVLDDSTDETTECVAKLVAELRRDGHDVHHIYRADRSGYKAGALAAGLDVARGEYAAVFDADFVPPPDFLRNTVPFLLEDPRCGFVQTRWGHRNRDFSLLTMLQSIGIDGHFVVEQPARSWNGLFCNFNGTAGLWRIETIRDAGGWKADTLTEDLDLSYRALLAGWHPRFLRDVITPAEVPTDINALKAQQRRWAKGSIQVALKLLPTVLRDRNIRPFKKIQAALHLTHYMIHPLILVMTLLVLPLIQLLQFRFTSPFTAPLVAVMLLALFGPSSMYLFSQVVSGQNWKRALLVMPALVTLGIGLAVNNSRAVLDAFLGGKSEFVRTPKLGEFAEMPSPGSAPATQQHCIAYRLPLNRLFVFEIIMGIWAMASFLAYLIMIDSFAGALLLVQAVGFTYVGVVSVKHHRYVGKLGC